MSESTSGFTSNRSVRVSSSTVMSYSAMYSGVAIGAEQGGAGGQGKGYTRLYDRATLALSATFTGASAWDRLGSVVRYVGDVDGDGKADLAVGTDPRDAAGDPTALGYVRVLSGADGTEIHAFSGAALDTGYGSRLAALGDVDGDGFADLAIGAPRADLNFVDAGFIEVRSGADGSILQKVSGQAAGDLFGQSLASAGDVDGDGSADLAVASPGSDVAAPDAGLVQVISFETWANLGAGVAGSGGIVPKLEGEGSLEPLSEVTLTLTDALPLADVDLVLGYSAYVDPLTGCLAPVPDVIVEGLQTDAAGDAPGSRILGSPLSCAVVSRCSSLSVSIQSLRSSISSWPGALSPARRSCSPPLPR